MRPTPADRRARDVAAALAVAALLASGSARGSAFAVQGVGPTGVAEASARAARADDGSAAFYDPAGLAFGQGTRAEVGAEGAVSALHAQGATHGLDDPLGVTLSLAATVPLEGVLRDRIRIGFAGYFLPTTAAHLVTPHLGAPFLPYYEGRTERLVAMPALGLRLARFLAIGAGVDVLAGVSGPADVRDGASGAPEPRIDEEAQTILAGSFGLRVDPTEHVHLALVYRQRFGVPSKLDTTADVGGVPLHVTLDTGEALFDPATFVVASSVDVGRASLEVDASLQRWSEWAGPYAKVAATLPGVAISSKIPDGLFRDTLAIRAAASYPIDVGAKSTLVLRLGGGYEPSILSGVPQGTTNLVDAGRVIAGAGAALRVREFVGREFEVALGAGAHVLTGYAEDKRACVAVPCPATTVVGLDATRPSEGITNPGYPRLEGGGSFWSLALSVGVAL